MIVLLYLKRALKKELGKRRMAQSELARRMGVDEKAVRRMLDPTQSTRVETLERAIHTLGKTIEVRVYRSRPNVTCYPVMPG